MKKPLMKAHLALAKHHLNISKLHAAQAEDDKDNAEFHKSLADEHGGLAASHTELCKHLEDDEDSGDTKKFLAGIDTNVLRDELNIREDADPVNKVRGVVDFSKNESRRVTMVPRAGGPTGEPDLSAEPDLAELIG